MPVATATCGTRAAYAKGCRCPDCKRANADQARALAALRRSGLPPVPRDLAGHAYDAAGGDGWLALDIALRVYGKMIDGELPAVSRGGVVGTTPAHRGTP